MLYQYSKTFRLPFDEVVTSLQDSLMQQGFSMMTTLDVNAHVRSELSVRFRNYTNLSVCNPELSYKAISLESHVGIVLPCNIVIQEHENGQTEISAVNPMETLDHNMTTASLELIGTEVSTRLRSAIDSIHLKKSTLSFSYN